MGGPVRTGVQIQPGALDQRRRLRAGRAVADAYAIQLAPDEEANADTLALIDNLKLAPLARNRLVLDCRHIVARLPASAVSALAARPDVVSLSLYQPKTLNCERQAQIMAGNIDGNLPGGPGYLDWLAGKGFTREQFEASGFVVDLADSGLDNGTTAPNHSGLYTLGETTNSSRVAYVRLEGFPNGGSTLKGCDGHGTLNTHVVAGCDARGEFPFADGSGYHYGLGICPFVRVGSSVIFDPTHFTSPAYDDMLSRVYLSGGRIGNNSWGDDLGQGDYDLDALEYDALVRDAQPAGSAFPAPGNQEFVVVFAAGNDGTRGSGSVGAPATAKNVICVGASENVQPFGGADSSGITDSEANSLNDIASFSSRGPCLDGRQKPDLVAPGTHISGGVAQAANPEPTGSADSCFTGAGVSGGPSGSDFFPLGQQFFTASSGTSHSTPAVVGAAALLRQWFINRDLPPPSPAMTKAFLVNSARYLTGTGANDSLWSPRQGMGLADLGRAFDGQTRVLRDQLNDDLFTGSGQSRTFTATIQDLGAPLRITLAWTDAPGSTVGAAYNNDLDLVVTVGGVAYYGNVFNGEFSTSGGTPDFKNNLESVLLPPGSAGTVTIQILAANINSDGVPNNDEFLDQDFALVAYNVQLAALPSLRPAGHNLLSEDCGPANGRIDPGEIVTLDFGLRNIGTLGTTNLSATLLATGGVTPVTVTQEYGALPADGSTTFQPFTLMPVGACGGSVVAQLLLQEGEAELGIIEYQLDLGKLITVTNFVENFDSVSAPDLPSGWLASRTGEGIAPVRVSTLAESAPNSSYLAESDITGTSELTSPWMPVSSSQARLSFWHRYDTEIDPYASSLGYDGGVLEVRLGTNDFTDILAAGGALSLGGYTRQIDTSDASGIPNPLGGRMGWCGDSGGFIQTMVSLPPSAAGSEIQFRWRLGTDTGNYYGGSGWYIDSIYLYDGTYQCCAGAPPVFAAAVMANGTNVLVRVESVAGYRYLLEFKASLLDEQWTEIPPATPGTGAELILEDPASAHDKRFYRVRALRP